MRGRFCHPAPPFASRPLVYRVAAHLSPLSPVKLGRSPDAGCTSPQRWIPTPDQEEDQAVALINAGFPHYNFHNVLVTPVRCAPLPALW